MHALYDESASTGPVQIVSYALNKIADLLLILDLKQILQATSCIFQGIRRVIL